MLASLTGRVGIELFALRGRGGEAKELTSLLEAFERDAKGKLALAVHLDADRSAWPQGLLLRGEGAPVTIGLVIAYGSQKAWVTAADGLSIAELEVSRLIVARTIRELRDTEEKRVHRIGYLQGHDERGFAEVDRLLQRSFGFFQLVAVELGDGDKEIDPTLDGLLVMQPRSPVAHKELRRLDQFLMRGKTVAVFANPIRFHDGDASMQASFRHDALDELLNGYGLTFPDAVLVDRAQMWVPLESVKGVDERLDPYAAVFAGDPRLLAASVERGFAPFVGIEGLTIPFPTEIVVDRGTVGGGVEIRPVVRTTSEIATISGKAIALHPELFGSGASASKTDRRQATVGVALTGPIRSAYPAGGEGLAVPAHAPACDGAETSCDRGKLLVVSSAAFVGNLFRELGKSPFAGQIPGMDPNMGADATLLRYASAYDRRAGASSLLVLKQTCDWMIDATW